MSVILLLLGVSLLLALGFLLAFCRAVQCGQFDDVETPAMRILIDDDKESSKGNKDDRRSTTPA